MCCAVLEREIPAGYDTDYTMLFGANCSILSDMNSKYFPICRCEIMPSLPAHTNFTVCVQNLTEVIKNISNDNRFQTDVRCEIMIYIFGFCGCLNFLIDILLLVLLLLLLSSFLFVSWNCHRLIRNEMLQIK